MTNAEVVLRFFVLSDAWRDFSGSFRDSLDEFMRANQMSDQKTLQRYEDRFVRAIEACEELFGAVAFKRPVQNAWRDQFLMGMFDAQMVGAAEADDLTISAKIATRANLIDELRKTFRGDREFESSVREATNTPSRIKYRIERLIELLRG